jgi:hypothetical protein
VVDIDIHVGIASSVGNIEISEWNTINVEGRARSEFDSDSRSKSDGDSDGGVEGGPSNRGGRCSSWDLLPNPRSGDSVALGLRSGPLNDGISHAHVDCTDNSSTTPAATSGMPSGDLEGSLAVLGETGNVREITLDVLSVEFAANKIGPVRISPSVTPSPSGEVSTSEDCTREVERSSVGLNSSSSNLSTRVLSSSLGEVEAYNQTISSEGRVNTLETSGILNLGNSETLSPNGEGINKTTEV